ncbi:MAG: hypothetical protein Q9226_002073 [Calogaya cf. arnoldii]
MHKDHPASIGAGWQYGGHKINHASYSHASAKDKEVDDFLASITARSPHSSNDDDKEDDKMDALIRSVCPDNLNGQKCVQSACRGLRLCPKFNNKHKTCDDAASCGLLHIRTTCKALLIGEPCDADNCDMGHDHPAARIAVHVKRRDEAAQAREMQDSAFVRSHLRRTEVKRQQRAEKRLQKGREGQYP